MITYVAMGIAVGFALSAPVGPVNLLVMHHALKAGWLGAFVIGAGAAVADTLFAGLAALGLASFTQIINVNRDPIRLVGGMIMLGFAIYIWRAHPADTPPEETPTSLLKQAAAACMMTLSNPGVLMAFAAIFAGTGFKSLGWRTSTQLANSVSVSVGVLLGALLWWLVLSFAVARYVPAVSDLWLARINQLCALALGCFGLLAVVAGLIE